MPNYVTLVIKLCSVLRKGDLDRLSAHIPAEVRDAANVALKEAKKLIASGIRLQYVNQPG